MDEEAAYMIDRQAITIYGQAETIAELNEAHDAQNAVLHRMQQRINAYRDCDELDSVHYAARIMELVDDLTKLRAACKKFRGQHIPPGFGSDKFYDVDPRALAEFDAAISK